MLTTILQASIIFLKASLYSIAYIFLSGKSKERYRSVLMVLFNFLIFFTLSKIAFLNKYPFLSYVLSILLISVGSSIFYKMKFKKTVFYYLIIFVVFIKANIYSSFISLLIYERPLPLLDTISFEKFILLIFSTLVIYVNIFIVRRCIKNYNSLSSKVAFNMHPFLITNMIILFINFIVNFSGYMLLREHLLEGPLNLKVAISLLFLTIELLILIILKLYNILIRNNIRLTLVRDMAHTDALTGVLSREKGLSILKSKIHASRKSNDPLTICFIDINNLKKVNDRFGHEEGDRLIEIVSSTIKRMLRKRDVMCRLGGDEFLLVFDSCLLNDAKFSWSRIEKKLKSLNYSKDLKFCVSVSVGFAQYDKRKHTSIKCLIKEADEEMYKQKKINKFYEKVNDIKK